MRALAAGCLVGVALVFTGCGTSTDAGKVAKQTIEDDWEGFYVGSSDPFPARHDLEGLDTIRSIHCGDKKQDGAGTLTCTLVVGHSKHGGTAKTVHVLVRFDSQGVLRQWKFSG
jgi:fructoselysine-6-P-deglycase FrlB-like protein